MNEFRDIHNSQNQFISFTKKLNSDSLISNQQKRDFNKFIEENQQGRASKVKVGVARLGGYTSYFQILCHYFKKDIDEKLTDTEISKFVSDLDNDIIRSKSGKPYSSDTKNELLKILKKYLSWKIKDDIKYKGLVGWIKRYNGTEEKPILKLEEVELMSTKIKKTDIKLCTQNIVLFDSGCRISELLNSRIKDLEKRDKDSGGFVYILDVKGTKTKDARRKIALPLATKYLKEWLKVHPDKNNPNSYIFLDSYKTLVRNIKNLCKTVLSKDIPIHSYRHSSATYYAEKLKGAPSFYYRLGWSMFSPQGRRYVRKAVYEEESQNETTKIVESDRLEKLEKEIESIKQILYLSAVGKTKVDVKESERIKSAIESIFKFK